MPSAASIRAGQNRSTSRIVWSGLLTPRRDAPATHSVCPLEEQEDRAEGSALNYITPAPTVNGIAAAIFSQIFFRILKKGDGIR
jgi:hypothetical protein